MGLDSPRGLIYTFVQISAPGSGRAPGVPSAGISPTDPAPARTTQILMARVAVVPPHIEVADVPEDLVKAILAAMES